MTSGLNSLENGAGLSVPSDATKNESKLSSTLMNTSSSSMKNLSISTPRLVTIFSQNSEGIPYDTTMLRNHEISNLSEYL